MAYFVIRQTLTKDHCDLSYINSNKVECQPDIIRNQLIDI